jgi:glycerol-3-phosphate responsive antiterminator
MSSIALFQALKRVMVACDKIKGIEIRHFPIQFIRREVQVANATAVTVIVDVDAQILQRFEFRLV